ncbi:alpha/beta hydrolase [Streptomyces sp. JJ66]|uniref:alpha/beta hydrolase n=1 Tax=Streptomyces sp. JJ66 TaxID=2803843 RepID=UPI001C563349|nr:alpha/beta hydrolase [Streptomyces sp. JJ66]MBW1600584.1 alpha/beta hydrolase [Streptomyces sp. JJ66]
MTASHRIGARRQAWDAELSPSTRARDARGTLARYRTRSLAALRELRHRANVPYGPHPAERLHHFPPHQPGAPLVVFVHGGHWQESSKDDACFAAPALLAAGAGYVALGYGLAPARRLPEMTASVYRGLRWVRENAARLGGRADAVYAAGSSAGAHLVAMATADRDGVPLAGTVLLSGLYDLLPVVDSYVNDALGLDAATARQLSPLYRRAPRAGHVLLARGQHETDEYARQQDRFASALLARGHPARVLVAEDRDHFDLPLDLGDPATVLGRTVLDLLAHGPGR